jgi:cytidine deaminase
MLEQLAEVEEMDPRAVDALRDAKAAQQDAYAPYSKFKMGAAVVTSDNVVVRGALVENVSLGLAMCAERVALFSTVANKAGTPEILALVSRPTGGRLTWPCGACLQVAMELGGADMLIVASDGTRTESRRLRELAANLPYKR